jgi:hypothetical protein
MDELASAALSPRCVHHREAVAVGLCSRCGDQLCAACIAPGTTLCVSCFSREPSLAIAPMPWEDTSLSLALRVTRTLWALVRPWARADAFARGTVEQAFRFALLTALPMASLAYLIPLTHTLLFEPGFAVRLIGEPGRAEIAVDVARAMLLGVLSLPLVLALHALGLWLGSGFRGGPVAVRYVLYWSWLYPTLTFAVTLVQWGSASPLLSIALLSFPLSFVAWLSQYFLARRALRAGVGLSIAATLMGTLGRLLGEWAVSMALVLVSPPPPLP